MTELPRKDRQIASLSKKLISEYRRDFTEQNRQADKIIVWLVGISTAFIAVIISQANNLQTFNIFVLKSTVLFLSLTIVSGVLYRIAFYCLEKIEADLLLYFVGFLEGYVTPMPIPPLISKYSTAKEIAECLKRNFD